MSVILDLLRDEPWRPTRATGHSAGYDVRASLIPGLAITVYAPNNEKGSTTVDGSGSVIILPWERAVVPLGFRALLPSTMEAQLRPRSGLALKVGLTLANSPGTIDADFPDEWAALCLNQSTVPLTLTDGERVAQVVFNVVEHPSFGFAAVGRTTERAGGYGSTGRH